MKYGEIIAAIAIVIFVMVGFVCFGVLQHEKSYRPYTSYFRLLNVAKLFNEYQAQHGNWPTNLSQMEELEPEWATNFVDSYNASMILPYDNAKTYGELISYGRDKKLGGGNKYDRDIIVRFPTDVEANAQWNEQMRQQSRPYAK